MKKITALFMAVLMLATMAFGAVPALADDTYTLTISSQTAESSTNAQWLRAVADQISEATDGKVELQIYYSSTLVGETDVVSAIRDGLCDGGEVPMGRNTNLFPMTSLIMEPYSGLGSGDLL